MSILNYIKRSIIYYKKQHIASFSGTIVAAAVISASLILGASVKGSLKDLIALRLGNTHQIITSGSRLMTDSLTRIISDETGVKIAPVLFMSCSAISDSGLSKMNVNLIGIDSSFQYFSARAPDYIEPGEVLISENLSKAIHIKSGDEILIKIENLGFIPLNTPLTRSPASNISLRVKITAIAPKDIAMLNLEHNQNEFFNIFIEKNTLERKLKLKQRSNLAFIFNNFKGENINISNYLQKNYQLEDAGISISMNAFSNEIEISSQRVFIDSVISQKLERSNISFKHTLSYLVNAISIENRSTPYSFVTAINDTLIHKNEIIVNSWLADDLEVKVGDTVQLEYYVIGPLRTISTAHKSFKVSSIISLEHPLSDSTYMPHFPGLSDAGTCKDWDAGIPVDFKKIRNKDEEYWNRYRGLSKAFVSLEDGLSMWKNQYGNATSIRINKNTHSIGQINSLLKGNIRFESLGFNLINVKEQANFAADNAVDFAELFLGLNFFVILAALMLTAMLLSFNLASRRNDCFLLKALGIPHKKIFSIFFFESLTIQSIASAIGAMLGLPLSALLIYLVNNQWNAIVRNDLVSLHSDFTIIIIAFIAALFAAMIPVSILVFKFLKLKSKKEKSVFYFSFTNLSIWHLVAKRLISDRQKSIFIILMLSIGIFTLFITASFISSVSDDNSTKSGSGGFIHWGETTLPQSESILKDDVLNILDPKDTFNVKFFQFHVVKGDEASCLNLNQVSQPRMIGIQANEFLINNRFSFSGRIEDITNGEEWKYMRDYQNDTVIIAFADQNVITYSLKKKLGDNLYYTNEFGKTIYIILAAGMKSSVFQGSILIPEKDMLRHFPSLAQARLILTTCDKNQAEKVQSILEKTYHDLGISIQQTTQRLSMFGSVQDTYLLVFIIMAAIAMLIATVGMGLLILRDIRDRATELHLMRAIGFTDDAIKKMLFSENIILVSISIVIGTLLSLPFIVKILEKQSQAFPFQNILWLLLIIIFNLMLWIYFSISTTRSKPQKRHS